MRGWPVGRIVSLAIAVVYWIILAHRLGLTLSLYMGVFLAIPLVIIWYGDDLEIPKQALDGFGSGWDFTPGCMIRALGWLILLVPAVWWVVRAVRG